MFKLSKNGLNLIASFEGCVLNAYRDPAGFLTIGYGHLIKSGDGFTDKSKITQSQALQLFQSDLKQFEDCVNKSVNVPLTQNQFDSLVSLSFNIGCYAFRRSTLLKLLNQGLYLESSNQFLKWTFAGGKILTGLVNRRKLERDLFLK